MNTTIQPWNRLPPAAAAERAGSERTDGAAAAGTEAAATAAGPGADQLQLSAVATGQARLDPGFDRAKVDAIKQAVRSGNYPLDPHRMAESFLALEHLIRE